jgi:hypothetical protein
MIIITLFLSFLSFANAQSPQTNNGGSGISIGNGGQSVICKDTDQKILSSEAFDLFEGRALFGYNVSFLESTPALELALQLAKKVDDSQGGNRAPMETVIGKVNYIAKNMRLLPPGVGLVPIEDSKEFVLPKNCEIVQTINFRENFQIYVDSDIWNVLPETSKAALYLHEAIYWQFREDGLEQDSRRTRKAVSFLLSGGELSPRAKFVSTPDSPVQYCHSMEKNKKGDYNSKFFAYQYNGIEIFQFLQIGGFGLLGRTILSRNMQPSSTTPPISMINEKMEIVESWLNSQPDIETFLQLKWQKGKIQLFVRFQGDAPFEDKIVCEAYDFSQKIIGLPWPIRL